MDIKQIKKLFVLQHDRSDCGVACLSSIIKYYGGHVSLEYLRDLSGTTKQGTTMLGLTQAAMKTGLNADGYKTDIENLKEIKDPCVLHILLDNRLQHYVICYGYIDNKFIIGDPGEGIKYLNEESLNKLWLTKTLIIISPGDNFSKTKQQKNKKWKWFFEILKPDIRVLILSVVLGVFITLAGMSTAIFSQKLLDEYLPGKDSIKLITGLVLLFLLLFARSFLSYLRTQLVVIQSGDFNKRLIGRFYNNLLNLPKSFFDSRKTGELVARMNDTSRIQSTINSISSSLVIDILIVVTSIIFISSYSSLLFILIGSSIPLYFFLIYLFIKPITTSQREVMKAYAQNESNYINSMQGIGAIKSLQKEDIFEQLNKNIYGLYQQSIINLGKTQNKLNISADILGSLIFVLIITTASYCVLKGEIKIGQLVAVLTISGGIFPAVSRLAMINIQIQSAKIAFDRMYEFAGANKENKLLQPENPLHIDFFASLCIKNLSFGFPGREPLFNNISLAVTKGEILIIQGESGSGKSTLIQILQKFYNYENGNILINDKHELKDLGIADWRKLIGVIPQDIHLFNGTLLENIAVELEGINPSDIINFCKDMGLAHFFERFPNGFYTILGEEGINISGGQKQLVGIARALYKKPQLLILDESTSAMDKETEKNALSLFEKIKNKLAIIFITHKNKLANNYSDKTITLSENNF